MRGREPPAPAARSSSWWRPALASLAALLAGGCGDTVPATQVMVQVEADLAVQRVTERVRLEVFGRPPDGAFPAEPRELITVALADASWPLTHALVPLDGDVQRVYKVEAFALGAGDEEVARARVISGYVPGRRLLLRIRFYSACLGLDPCVQPELSCGSDGECSEPAVRLPANLPAFGLDAGPPPECSQDHLDCDDLVACTLDRCTEGLCVHTPQDSACADGSGATCDLDKGCQYATCDAATCAAADACSDAECSGAICQRTTTCGAGQDCCGGACCALGQMCCGGTCVLAGCNDGNSCTDDSCVADRCQNRANNQPCSDGRACNGPDRCGGGACVPGTMDICPGGTCQEPPGTPMCISGDAGPPPAIDGGPAVGLDGGMDGGPAVGLDGGMDGGPAVGLDGSADGCAYADPFETVCDDLLDNDCDMDVDCADTDCSGDPLCASFSDGGLDGCVPAGGAELNCTDLIDNDCNGLVDCADPNCSARPACSDGGGRLRDSGR